MLSFQPVIPQCSGLFKISRLDSLEFFLRKAQGCCSFFSTGQNTAQVHGLKSLHGLAPALGKVLLKLFSGARPKFMV